MEDLELLPLKELQDKLVELGMPADDVSAFKTKAPVIASIKTLMARKAVVASQPVESTEVKKVATIEEKVNPTEEKAVNRHWKDKATKMKYHLEKQETVNILIPLEPGEKPGVVEWRTGKDGETYQVAVSGAVDSVQLNGCKWFVPKGKYTPVPRQVAEVISKSQQQTLDAGSDKRLDRTDPQTGRPMNEIM